MPVRFVVPLIVALGSLIVAVPVEAQQQKSIYRDGFAGRNTLFVAGDANIKFVEKDHKLSGDHAKSAATSELIKIEANPPAGATEPEFVHYYYSTPQAPITERLTAQVWVKAFRKGIQLKARVVFPKEKDPTNPAAMLTTLIAGDTYDRERQWQPLGLGKVEEQLNKHLKVLHARVGRAVDPTDAYIDRLVLNVYAGPGLTEVWVDDLEIGPVRPEPELPQPRVQPGTGVGRPKTKGRRVEFADSQILVEHDNGEMEPFFMLAIRHSDTPLKTLRDAQLNTIWYPADAQQASLDEAIRHGFWIVPTLPLPAGVWEGRSPKKADPAVLEKDAELVSGYLRKFMAADAVLMWDLGGARTAEDVGRVARVSELVRTYDPRRPRAIDLWDGYSSYSTYVNAVGAHRWPLFSSLEYSAYRDWLNQRKLLTSPGKLTWSWIQTHLPDWLVFQMTGSHDPTAFPDPIGPHPEQIRTLTYLSLAAGHRGIGYWSDKYLSNACHGRDRLLEIALLNTEIEMLKPALLSATDPANWVGTSDGNVQAAIIRGTKETIVLPVWLGAGAQYTPAPAVVRNLTIRVPAAGDNSVPWLVTPGEVIELKGAKREAGGTLITIPEFDTAAAVVFTTDLKQTGIVARWQDFTQSDKGKLAAQWAQQQAVEQYNKTLTTHTNIVKAGGPELEEAADLFFQSAKSIKLAEQYASNNQWDMAYRESRKAVRPLRVLMRADWQKAVETLDTPTASPFAVSFYTLPQHWQFAREVQASRPVGNGFPNGGFELSKPAPAGGAAVSSLPGWEVRKLILDKAEGTAAIVNTAEGLVDRPIPPPEVVPTRYAPLRTPPPGPEHRQPNAGRHCLQLRIDPKREKDAAGRTIPDPSALERTVLAVDSPAADFAPGTIVRISFWTKVLGTAATADGVVVFDSAGGEPLAVRIPHTGTEHGVRWKEFHLYRRVPPSGKIGMTFALTGFGTAFFDDVRIEPMVGATVK